MLRKLRLRQKNDFLSKKRVLNELEGFELASIISTQWILLNYLR